jgi:transcriptional regulator with XRE-family HTH domain
MIRADPTDAGRRVARRRTELEMTRAELAERAGMPVEFIDYVESRPSADPGIATLWRLAAALETSAYILLGAGRNQPPDRTGL